MIWVVGAKGMLGQEVVKTLEAVNMTVKGTDREVDFTDLFSLESFADREFTPESPLQWIVNCAAYTAVDKAEEDRDLCRKLNVDGPRNLGKLAKARGARVIHISTDYVFDGKGFLDSRGERRAYREEDPTGPQGYYGLTKAQGEEALTKEDDRSIILRTAWLYGAGGPNFVFTMLKLMKSRDSIGVVADQWGTPTWAADLASVVKELIQRGAPSAGIYHLSGEGVTNWHEFAMEIQRQGLETGLLSKACEVNALTTDQYPTKTVRPAWSVLDKTKIKSVFGLKIPDWKDSLRAFFNRDGQKFTL